MRMHRLVFDQPSSPVIQAGQLEPDVYAARCLVDPLFGLPPNARVVSPGAALRKLAPEQSRYSALDLACYLNRGWPANGRYDYNVDLPQTLLPVQLGDASYADSVCQWLSSTLQCPVDAHFLVTGSTKATHRSIGAELGSLRKLTIIADTSTLALVELPKTTPETVSFAFASTSVLQATGLPSTHRAAASEHPYVIESPSPQDSDDLSTDVEAMMQNAAHASMPSYGQMPSIHWQPASDILNAAECEAALDAHTNTDCRTATNALLQIDEMQGDQIHKAISDYPWMMKLIQRAPQSTRSKLMQLFSNWVPLLKSGYAIQLAGTSRILFKKSMSVVLYPETWNGQFIPYLLEFNHLAFLCDFRYTRRWTSRLDPLCCFDAICPLSQ